jgi:RNA polymerase sigma-70 factor (ECF subfamily)
MTPAVNPEPDLSGFSPRSEAADRLERVAARAAAGGDRDAWDWLYRHTAERLGRFVAWRVGGRKDLADDAVQETWLTIAKSLECFDADRGSFAVWACGVAANVIRNRLRDWRRSSGRTTPLTGDEPGRAAGDTALRIAEVLANLPTEYEAVLRGKYLDGRTVAEMAAATGDSEKAIESRLTRAREAFRGAYG